MPVWPCFRFEVWLSQGLSRSHSRLEQIVRFPRVAHSSNFETCFITPSSYNKANLEFCAHFGPNRNVWLCVCVSLWFIERGVLHLECAFLGFCACVGLWFIERGILRCGCIGQPSKTQSSRATVAWVKDYTWSTVQFLTQCFLFVCLFFFCVTTRGAAQ